MQQVIPISEYRRGFEPTVSDALSAGKQVIVNLQSHYVRLESLNEDGFVIDDPGHKGGETQSVPWKLGIADGYFRKYFIVS